MRASAAGHLSDRQKQVLSLAARGLHDGEIGAQLGLSRSTVRQHLCRIHKCLSARNTAHAVALALTQQIIEFSESEHDG